ncbi:MAG: hypothetical protein NBV68_02530 [Erythrobacter sp.]|uniref:hypothetical protein n=1 Tax=Erythrobacter sp. TaxID=1042 RepID=UPI0025D5854E|nr:hypothetical protein [Erythrobacter sp.]MCL9998233.1 hypothetical protein [Erythrobacter sp.]
MHRISRHPRVLIGCLAAALTAATALPAAAQSDVQAAAAPLSKGEQRLAKLLEGRVAGEPVRCIRAFRNVPMQTIEGTAYVYGRGNTIWVQRTRDPEQIDDDDVLIVDRRDSTQLCRLDFTTTVDRFTGFFSGAVFLEDFVPYTRVKTEAAGEG